MFRGTANAELHVSPFYGNHMVLQREQPVPVWGRATPGGEVSVAFREHQVTTRADANGRWQAKLPAMQVGEPAELIVRSENEIRKYSDVLVGEVWLAGGQSNMARTVGRVGNAEAFLADADYPMIRLFHVDTHYSAEPLEEMEAVWRMCSAETAADFSAVAYHFGVTLWRELGVPIGLISSSQGGTPAETWFPGRLCAQAKTWC